MQILNHYLALTSNKLLLS